MRQGAAELEKNSLNSRGTREFAIETGSSTGPLKDTAHQQGASPAPAHESAPDGDQKVRASPRPRDAPATTARLERIKTSAACGAFVASIAALAWSIHSFQIQEKRLQSQLELQQESLKQQRAMDSFKRLVELLPKIGCKADPQREIALDLLKTDAPERLRLVLPVIEKCPAVTAETTRKIQALKQQAADSEFESAFVFMVGNGRQYLLNSLQGAAARTFNTAADSIPKTYLANGILDPDQVSAARRAFAAGQFSEAADLFAKAYRKVPANTAFDSSAFRREPPPEITNSGNKGDAK